MYMKEAEDLTCRCQDNSPLLNVHKTKEQIVDLGRKQRRNYITLNINEP